VKAYTVYRSEYRPNRTVRIGKVVDQRRAERNNNAADMLRLAQKIYATSSIDSSIFIVKEGSSEGPIFEGA
jgi:ribosomal protein L2